MGGCVSSKGKTRIGKKRATLNLLTIQEIDGQFDTRKNQNEIKDKITSSIENIYYYYTFVQQLGKGGFGSVWKCHKKNDQNDKVAVKIISKNLIKYTTPLIIQRELSIFKSMDHPNICKFLETYTDQEYIYIVTELLEGGTLQDRIDKGNQFTEKEIGRIIKQLLWAISYLHSKNVIHRDLKMENICFKSKNQNSDIKIIDFGISKKIEMENQKEISQILKSQTSVNGLSPVGKNPQIKYIQDMQNFNSLGVTPSNGKLAGKNSIQLMNLQHTETNQSTYSNKLKHKDTITFENMAKKEIINNSSYTNQLSPNHSQIQYNPHSYYRQNTPQVGTSLYRAPEVLQCEDYDLGCDVWSLGVITYQLFTKGRYPFYDEYEIEEGSVDFETDNVWKSVSPEAKNLINSMLTVEKSQRITVKKALIHPWFQKLQNSKIGNVKLNADSVQKRAKILEKILNFGGYTGFKKIALEIIVKKMETDEIDQETKDLFEQLDADKTGVISAQSLRNQLQKQTNQKISIQQVNNIIDKLSFSQSKHELKKYTTNRESIQVENFPLIKTNNNKKQYNSELNYTEFLAATLEKDEYLQQDLLKKLFKYIDVRENGYIEVEDIETVLSREGKKLPEKSVRAIFREMLEFCVPENIDIVRKSMENNQLPRISSFLDHNNNSQDQLQQVFGFNSFCKLMGFNKEQDQLENRIKHQILSNNNLNQVQSNNVKSPSMQSSVIKQSTQSQRNSKIDNNVDKEVPELFINKQIACLNIDFNTPSKQKQPKYLTNNQDGGQQLTFITDEDSASHIHSFQGENQDEKEEEDEDQCDDKKKGEKNIQQRISLNSNASTTQKQVNLDIIQEEATPKNRSQNIDKLNFIIEDNIESNNGGEQQDAQSNRFTKLKKIEKNDVVGDNDYFEPGI